MADFGWEFSGWSGEYTGTSPTNYVTMDGDKAIGAHFTSLPVSVVYEWRAIPPSTPGVFTDRRIQRAVCLALSEESISALASSEYGIDVELRPWDELAAGEYSLGQARQLLSEAGYPNGFRATALVADDDDEVLVFIAGSIQYHLREAGIELDLVYGSVGDTDMTISRIVE